MLLDFINTLAFFTLFLGFVGFVGVVWWLTYITIDTVYDWIIIKLKGDDNHG